MEESLAVISILANIKKNASYLRMAALGYRYDYSRAKNEKIITSIWSRMRVLLENSEPSKRRLYRAMAQFRAHLLMRPIKSAWAFEVASLFAFPLFIVACWLGYLAQGRDRGTNVGDGIQLVFGARWKTNPEIFAIPETLAKKIMATEMLSSHRLSSQDVALVLKVLYLAIQERLPFPLQFTLKCAVDIALVRAAIRRYTPKFVLVYWEYSCSLSVITQALAQNGIETYNIMHGDKHYYAKHAFFEVHRCYCWNEFYVDVFRSEYVHAQFHCFTNPSFVLKEEERSYLADHESAGVGVAAPHLATLVDPHADKDLAAIQFANALNALAKLKSVTIRSHPFYAEEFRSIRSRLSTDVTIQLPRSKSARAFLLDHNIIVGTASTLLLEAAHLGLNVVIIRTQAMADLERHHYLYTMENVSVCTLESLNSSIAAINLNAKVSEIGEASSPLASSCG